MKLGLALSGGAVRGMAHIGVLKFLEENNITAEFISGTSAGSIVGGLYAAGYTAIELEEIALSLNWRGILRKVMRIHLPRMGLVSLDFLADLLEKYLDKRSFADLKKPLKIIAVDIVNNQAVTIENGDLVSAILASCAIPGIFVPIERESLLLVDGGVLHNVPTQALRETDVKRIIAVNVNAHAAPTGKPKTIFEVLYKSIYLMTRTNEKEDMEMADYALIPPIKDIGMWDFARTEDLIRLGYEEAKKSLAGTDLLK